LQTAQVIPEAAQSTACESLNIDLYIVDFRFNATSGAK